MPRGFLVKRSRRPTPISYRTRCCYPEAGAEAQGGGPTPPLVLPPPLPPPPLPRLARPGLPSEGPPFPGFGTPCSPPSPPAPLHSPARAVSEERRPPLGSPLSAESFPPLPEPPPLLLGHGAELKLWAAIAAPPPRAPGPAPPKRPQARKAKAARKLHFEDEVTTSPVLGLRIKEGPPETAPPPQAQQQAAATTATSGSSSGPRSQPLGEFICQLCKERYLDPLSLAQHKCSRIVRVEYRCPECDKLFSCPANLASHRRWHKPRPPPAAPAAGAKAKAAPAPVPAAPSAEEATKGSGSERDSPSPEGGEELACPRCAKRFRRQSALRRHLPAHHEEEEEEREREEEEQQQPQQQQQQHPCPACGEAFPTKGGQERHLRLLHAAQAFPCKYCPATFYSSPGLTRHINKCHPSENRQVILLQVPLRPAC